MGYCQGFTEVPPDIAQNATLIYMSGNQIKSLKANSFNHTSCTALKITWDVLENIEAGAFNNLDSLSSLCLFNNKLTTINSGVFNTLSLVTNLQLQHNRIKKLESDSFQGMKSLTALYLNDNAIQQLPSLIFSNLSNLFMLDIQNNELITLSWDVFSSERDGHPTGLQLTISGNPFLCNVSMCWLYKAQQEWPISISWWYGPECTNLPSWPKMSVICGMKDEKGKIIHDYKILS